MRAALLAGAIGSGLLLSAWSCRPRPTGGEVGSLGPNAGCYVCHTTFLREPLSRTHLKAKVGCVRCHGVSADHANDEDIGATKPDIRFRRVQVNGHCRTCHARHDVAPEAVVARWRGRRASQPTSRPAVGGIVCTDCHGQHRIAKRRS